MLGLVTVIHYVREGAWGNPMGQREVRGAPGTVATVDGVGPWWPNWETFHQSHMFPIISPRTSEHAFNRINTLRLGRGGVHFNVNTNCNTTF